MPDDTQIGILIKSVADLAGFKEAEKATNGLSTKMSSVSQSLATVGEGMTKVGQKMSIAITAPLVALGTQAAVNFGKFSENIKRAGAFVDATAEQMKDLETATINASKKGAFSVLELSDALGSLLGGEIDVNTASEELGNIVDLALVSKMTNARDAVNLASLALTVFKDDIGSVPALMDRMAVYASNVDDATDSLARALQQSAGSARAAGISFDELIRLFSVMRRSGIDLDLAWAAFNSAISNVQSPTKQALEALDKVGISASDLAISLKEGTVPFLEKLRQGFEKAGGTDGAGLAFLMQVLGREAAPKFATALSLTNDQMEETSGWFDDVSGKGAELAKRLEESQGGVKRFQNAWTNFTSSVGGLPDQIFGKLADALQKISSAFSGLSPKQQDMISKMLLAVAAVGPLLIAFGSIAKSISSIISLMAYFGGPAAIGSFIAAIGAPVIAIVALVTIWVTQWDKIKAGFETAKDFIIAGMGFMKAEIGLVMVSIKRHIDDFVGGVANTWRLFTEGVQVVVDTVTEIWNNLPYYVGYALGAVGRVITDAFLAIASWLSENVPKMIDSISQFFQELPGKVWNSLKELYDGFVNWITSIWNWLKDTVPRIVESIVNFFKQLPGKMWNIIVGLWNNLKGAFDSFKKSSTQWASDTVDSIVNFFKQIPGKIASALSSGYSGAKSSLGEFVKGVKEGFGSLPSFDTGGVVPGPLGAPQLIIAHGGETVLPTHKDSGSSTTRNGDQIVNITFNVSEKIGVQEIARVLDQYLGNKTVMSKIGIS